MATIENIAGNAPPTEVVVRAAAGDGVTRTRRLLPALMLVACAPLPRAARPRAAPSIEVRHVEPPPTPPAEVERSREEMAAILVEQDFPAHAPRGAFVWPSRNGRDDLLVALGRTSLLWARRWGTPHSGTDNLDDSVAIEHVAPRFDTLDLNGDGEAELLLFLTTPDGGDEVVAWTRSGTPREPTRLRRLRRSSWLLVGARTRAEVEERVATLQRFAAPTDASPTESLVLRLQMATAAELRAVARPEGVRFCKVDLSRMRRGARRRCWSWRLGALPDADAVTVVQTFGVRPVRTSRPDADDPDDPDETEGPFAPRVWFEDPFLGDPPLLEGIAALQVSPPRPVCATRGAVHRCSVRVYGDEHIVPQFEWVFTGRGRARRLSAMTLTLRDYRGEAYDSD